MLEAIHADCDVSGEIPSLHWKKELENQQKEEEEKKKRMLWNRSVIDGVALEISTDVFSVVVEIPRQLLWVPRQTKESE